jgi:hypothetical protein
MEPTMDAKQAGSRRVLRELSSDERLYDALIEGMSDSELAMLLQERARAQTLPGLRRLLRMAGDRLTRPSST